MKTIVPRLKVTIRGRQQVLRRAVVEPVAGGFRVSAMDGTVLVKRAGAHSIRWAVPIEQRVEGMREALRFRRAARRIRARVPVTNTIMPFQSAEQWERIADLVEQGKVVAIDCSPKSESVYLAPAGADLSPVNRGPQGAYAGWVRVAWHGPSEHQVCECVRRVEDSQFLGG